MSAVASFSSFTDSPPRAPLSPAPAALLCLSNAAEGGESGWSSSVAVHNEILRRAPHLARVLAGPWFFDRKTEVPEGEPAACHALRALCRKRRSGDCPLLAAAERRVSAAHSQFRRWH